MLYCRVQQGNAASMGFAEAHPARGNAVVPGISQLDEREPEDGHRP